jgi:hypothetical protein
MVEKPTGISTGERRRFRLDLTSQTFTWYRESCETPWRVDEAGNAYTFHQEMTELCKHSSNGALLATIPIDKHFAGLAVSEQFGITIWKREPYSSTITHYNPQGEKQWDIPMMQQVFRCDVTHLADRIALITLTSVVSYMEVTDLGAFTYSMSMAPFDAVPSVMRFHTPVGVGYISTAACLPPLPSGFPFAPVYYRPLIRHNKEGVYLLRADENTGCRAVPLPPDLGAPAFVSEQEMIAWHHPGSFREPRRLVLLPAPDWKNASPSPRFFSKPRKFGGTWR